MNNAHENYMVPELFRVESIHESVSGSYDVKIVPINKGSNTSFKPGQFSMLYSFGVGEVAISISGDNAESGSLIYTIADVGVTTHALCTSKVGDVWGVRGSFGEPWPVEQLHGKDILLVAGGIGLAPIRAPIYYILNNREKFGKVTLLFGTRSPEFIYYKDELEKWSHDGSMDVQITVDKASSSWTGHEGLVTNLMDTLAVDLKNTYLMSCGPEIMLYFVAKKAAQMGFPDDHIYISMERNMKCGVKLCGRCQYGPDFVCKDGPVFTYKHVKHLLEIKEV